MSDTFYLDSRSVSQFSVNDFEKKDNTSLASLGTLFSLGQTSLRKDKREFTKHDGNAEENVD